MTIDRGLDVNWYNTSIYTGPSKPRRYVGLQTGLMKKRYVTWVTLRATSGIYRDSGYQENYNILSEAGIEVIHYGWLDPRQPWKPQAELLLETVVYGGRVMWDLEDTAEVKAKKGIFTSHVLPALDYTGAEFVYLNPAFMKYWAGEYEIEAYKLIIANWDAAAPRIPKPWAPGQAFAWQYTAKEDGISFGLTTKQAAPYVRMGV